MPTYVFHLYVTGQSRRSLRAAANLRRICDQYLRTDDIGYEIALTDVQVHPERAEAAQIFATPTTVRMAPLPTFRVIGDLSDAAQVLSALGIDLDTVAPLRQEVPP